MLTSILNNYPLSLHDALPICRAVADIAARGRRPIVVGGTGYWVSALLGGATSAGVPPDRKRTRLNSSHVRISYAVLCLKKKKLLMLICIVSKQLITSCSVIMM